MAALVVETDDRFVAFCDHNDTWSIFDSYLGIVASIGGYRQEGLTREAAEARQFFMNLALDPKITLDAPAEDQT